jgi:hypothetical protein
MYIQNVQDEVGKTPLHILRQSQIALPAQQIASSGKIAHHVLADWWNAIVRLPKMIVVRMGTLSEGLPNYILRLVLGGYVQSAVRPRFSHLTNLLSKDLRRNGNRPASGRIAHAPHLEGTRVTPLLNAPYDPHFHI